MRVKKNDINRVSHATGVNRAARFYQQTFANGRRWLAKKSAHALKRVFRSPGAKHRPAVGREQRSLFHRVPAETNLITSGKARMMKVTGKMNNTSGAISLTGASMAIFSAAWNRSVRRWLAITLSTGP